MAVTTLSNPPGSLNTWFLHPSQGWIFLEKAVTYDNWLTWRHVLPRDPASRGKLTPSISQLIERLAGALDSLHRKIPGYHQLGSSPYDVIRWWDPHATDGWELGNRCCFLIEDVPPQAMLAALKSSRAGISLNLVQDPATGKEVLEASFP